MRCPSCCLTKSLQLRGHEGGGRAPPWRPGTEFLVEKQLFFGRKAFFQLIIIELVILRAFVFRCLEVIFYRIYLADRHFFSDFLPWKWTGPSL